MTDGRNETLFRDGPDLPEMVTIPGGTFVMGSPAGGMASETPEHTVTLAPFAIGKHAVTFKEWDAYARAARGYSPVDNWGRGRNPVINVSWNDSQDYAAWLSATTGQRYRLPTEAEWEYAARAGTTAAFWTGAEIAPGEAQVANGAGATEVGRFPANAFGLHDVHGNVWEWAQDCWNTSYAGAPVDGSAWQTGDCTQRIARGGSWINSAAQGRSAFRFRGHPGLRSNCMGLRVARDI